MERQKTEASVALLAVWSSVYLRNGLDESVFSDFPAIILLTAGWALQTETGIRKRRSDREREWCIKTSWVQGSVFSCSVQLFYFLNMGGDSTMLSVERIVNSLISLITTWTFISLSSFTHSVVQLLTLNNFWPDNLLGNWFRHREEQMWLLKFKCFSSLLPFPPHSYHKAKTRLNQSNKSNMFYQKEQKDVKNLHERP